MSRNFFPVLLAIGVGVFTGTFNPAPLLSARYYTFQPTFQQMAIEKGQVPQQPPSTSLSQKKTDAPANPTSHGSKPETESSR
ncbi:uncharacterized protein N7482_004134 [Penicillium canariense]|uniref:Uncharacterized protein n=1 Tax=Penicillium canariense TaxID=189055 RepID=A0A9W9I620_9EURO|nr:uncharacterized protein N7482_004134 [Penicillium canariense]KAJ5168540.1 hypothetical protein N7482_004134 [Penicillium canariense]